MRADQFSARIYRRESQTPLEREINPVSKSGLQFGQCFPFCLAGRQQPAKARDACDKTFIFAEERDLSEL